MSVCQLFFYFEIGLNRIRRADFVLGHVAALTYDICDEDRGEPTFHAGCPRMAEHDSPWSGRYVRSAGMTSDQRRAFGDGMSGGARDQSRVEAPAQAPA